ncbi:MAG: Protein of avirulence locus ImpE [Akkermansiaceae bacterium]|nr:Protein of avirulence locus ImpE [Akkermansiaceae bacterium]
MSGALAAAKAAVRASPSDPSCRSALFALFAANGEWARASEQLDNCLRMGADVSLAIYGLLLAAVEAREKTMRGEIPAFIPGDQPPAWLASWQEALAALEKGDAVPLAAVAESRFLELDAIRGFNAEYEFEGFRNCDTRLAGVFEGVFNGRYGWLPFEDVLRIAVAERPELIQDLVWLPVMVHLKKVEPVQGYLFSTCPGTATAGVEEEKLAKTTGWDEAHDAVDIGRGAQLFALGSEVVPIFSLGQCSFHGAGKPAADPTPSDPP